MRAEPERAADQIRVALEITGDESLRELLAWAEFLAGNLDAAAKHWGSSPPSAAVRQLDRYNEALSLAQVGDFAAAERMLSQCDPRLIPARTLRSHIMEAQSGKREIGPGSAERPARVPSGRVHGRFPAAVVAVGVALLILGGLGVWQVIRTPTVPPTVGGAGTEPILPPEPVPQPPVQIEAGPAPDRHPVIDRLLATITGSDPDTPLPFPPLELTAGPVSIFAEGIPEDVRSQVGRSWYLIAVLDERAPSVRRDLLVSALALVGAAAPDYWVDDALYEAMMAFEHEDPNVAAHLAQLIATYHPESMFVNSVTRSLLPG